MLMKCRRKYWKAATGEELEPQMPYTGASPETAVIAKADSRRAHRRYNGQIFEVKRRLEAFPPSAYLERYLIERCHLEGAEVSVICTVTGLPEADVKKRLRSGLRRLKQPQLELSL
jgi:DNA-directed RNA polymerase specialized sigma24 family protein